MRWETTHHRFSGSPPREGLPGGSRPASSVAQSGDGGSGGGGGGVQKPHALQLQYWQCLAAACTTHNANMCESCDVGWRMNSDKTVCGGLYSQQSRTTLAFPTQLLQIHAVFMIRVIAGFIVWDHHLQHHTMRSYLLPHAVNACNCPNGSPALDAACTTHDANICESCNVGWRLK